MLDRAGVEWEATQTPLTPSQTRFLFVPLLDRGDPFQDWQIGSPGRGSGMLAFEALRCGVDYIEQESCAGLLTAPISKEWVCRAIEREFPGHTDYLADRFHTNVLMLMHSDRFSVVPLTIHIPLAAVPEQLKRIVEDDSTLELLMRLARMESYRNRRFAVCGVNPHSGEGGMLGREESDFLDRAVDRWRERGLPVDGPLPADAAFLEENRREYRLILCGYHDQALVPFKALEGRNGVNVTIGLPFLRTSPDHGTAFSLAGSGTCDPTSIRNALHLLVSDRL